MLGFIDSGLLAKEIVLNFPDQQQQILTPDIYSAIKSLSLMILGSDTHPSPNSQNLFCKTLRNVCDEMFQLNYENDDPLDDEALDKIEDLAQQAIDWKMKNSNESCISQGDKVTDHRESEQSGSQQDASYSLANKAPQQPPPLDIKILMGLFCLCWGSTMAVERFRPIYPNYTFSKSGIVLWVKKLEDWVENHRETARSMVENFERSHPTEMPLKYVYEIRRDLLQRRLVSKKKICRVDIKKGCTAVLQKHGVMERFEERLTTDFYEAVFHATSKISWEKKFRGVTQFIYQRNEEWFV